MAGKECMPVGSYSEQLVEISVQRNATQRNLIVSYPNAAFDWWAAGHSKGKCHHGRISDT
jgi:hypothetical protein